MHRFGKGSFHTSDTTGKVFALKLTSYIACTFMMWRPLPTTGSSMPTWYLSMGWSGEALHCSCPNQGFWRQKSKVFHPYDSTGHLLRHLHVHVHVGAKIWWFCVNMNGNDNSTNQVLMHTGFAWKYWLCVLCVLIAFKSSTIFFGYIHSHTGVWPHATCTCMYM